MKISEIVKPLTEAINNPYPIVKLRPTAWEIHITDDKSDSNKITYTIIVNVAVSSVKNFKMLSLLFRDTNSGNMNLVNHFKGAGASRVLASIKEIISRYRGIDLMVFISSDTNVEVEGKKARLYMIVLNMLKNSGFFAEIGQTSINDVDVCYAIPNGSPIWKMNQKQIDDLIFDFGIAKQQGSVIGPKQDADNIEY